MLKVFANRTITVPQVLFELISDRRCIPLREFYEIILKAHHRGILEAAGEAGPAEAPAHDWGFRAAGQKVRPMVVIASMGAVVSMALQTLALPTEAWELGLGWLLACLLPSAGYFLAACVARPMRRLKSTNRIGTGAPSFLTLGPTWMTRSWEGETPS
ncbi:MAG: hypothetical protein J6386_08405 [Candidatus Synoicihabitans palmerolidicus]|nr:hypothetical protein [Candidatus Synoicihabitans palmerolidicus]